MLDAAYLTDALRTCGTLPDGTVADVVVESTRDTILSRISKLRLTYSGDATGAPDRLIMKSGQPERDAAGWVGGRREVAFYREVAPLTPPGMVPRCLDAAHDAATNAWHILLEDLSATHATPTVWPLPPSLAQCERIIGTLARFHAAWWGDPRLGVSVGALRDAAEIAAFPTRLTACFASVADAVPEDRRALFERLFVAVPRLLNGSRTMTIMHGDAHVWNCFLPRDPETHAPLLFDWDAWRIGMGASDLAYMMALHWYPDRRRRMEAPLLDHYHAALVAGGVRGYDRTMLDADYRCAVLLQLTTPVLQAAHGIPPVIWWNHLERILLAYEDLGCADLLP